MKEENKELSKTNFEKIGVYIWATTIFFSATYYIIEMKVDIGKLQVKVEELEKSSKPILDKVNNQ